MGEGNIQGIRKDYGVEELSKTSVLDSPIDQFELWFKDAMKSEGSEVNACVLSTLAEDNCPEGRVVLLKFFAEDGFTFYTNYESKKAQQLAKHPFASMTFYWRTRERQIRLKGRVEKVSAEVSDAYYFERPEGSQLGAWASPQSQEIPDRAFLKKRVENVKQRFETEELKRPDFWGGYILIPTEVEFWQGRPSRLHDRIVYSLVDGQWVTKRLAP
ncbi:Pyridoxamine 5'-phosphate oxidase [Reichenbachiella agariperforans]|uniref:Pyridoxine/pyridoxamine 5'-phosphate oxidase n=1 Tax=Reichenbachiella agariperforans TaxID=156994 RepID=A0A1M6KR87_REIAG|nr:pyridoxamine 5'-phosphate oxidase [Reichenbachiella agariperforans]SHJ61431.1 Pyridoxamine 5'-phosphate oxidase [Reichenbachiella agariperforans]